ncbi:MAG: phosphodiester glycosidase family protein [bacterium]|nr:MAG: phosphodiester glycosidase family protein [bacterium]
MKKLLFTLLVFNLLLASSFSQITFHTHSTTQVGPGIVYKHITVASNLWNINVLEIDLQNPYVVMETVKANDRLSGYEQTSSMAARKSASGHRVTGAVNGDFYAAGGIPLGTQVINGKILKNPINWPVLAFEEQNLPAIDPVNFNGDLTAGGQSYSFTAINQDRGTDQLILYNSFFGASTGTNIWGTEISVTALEPWIVNDTLLALVDDKSSAGNMSIIAGKAVVSGHGAAGTFLQNNVQIGDTIQLALNLQPNYPRLMQAVGGNLKIVDNGAYTGSTNTDVHPRTAAGFSANHRYLYLATVDGRVPGTYRGMSYRELADLMIYLGADEAINLDGGGSSTMVIHGEIKNHPSDGSERSVANALLTVSEAPLGTGVYAIQVEPDNERVFLKNSIQLKVSGWNEYFHPEVINPANLQYSIDPNLGQVTSDGLLTVANEPDSGYVYVDYNGLLDSAYIFIKGIREIDLQPEQIVTDTIRTVQFTVLPTDVDGLHPDIPLNDYQWSCLDPAIGQIDSVGRFKGSAEGQARVVAQFKDQSDTSRVTVQIGTDVVVIDSMETTTGWNISGVLYDPLATTLSVVDTPRTLGQKAFRLDYQFVRSAQGRSWVYLDTDIPVYGLPDTIMIDIKSNNMNHIADLIISDDNDELFTASTGLFAASSNQYETYKIPITNFNAIDPASSFNFPIRIQSLQVKLWYVGAVGDTNRGVLYFDNLQVKYPVTTSILKDEKSTLPQNFILFQNYPNPFNPDTNIRYKINISQNIQLEIFDLLGQKVNTLVNQQQPPGTYNVRFDGKHLASGVYLCRLKAGNQVRINKMILMR